MSATALQAFQFESSSVRTTIRDGDPWWVAPDVCGALGINNSRQAVSRLDDDEKGVISSDTLGGNQELTIVNESGLYNLIFRSRKPEAKRFRKWVTSEVLPAIRKTGRYAVSGVSAAEIAACHAKAVLGIAEQQINHEQRLSSLESKIESIAKKTEGDEPYVSVRSYCKLRNLRLAPSQLVALDLMIEKCCRRLGIEFKTLLSETSGRVNIFPKYALECWEEGASLK